MLRGVVANLSVVGVVVVRVRGRMGVRSAAAARRSPTPRQQQHDDAGPAWRTTHKDQAQGGCAQLGGQAFGWPCERGHVTRLLAALGRLRACCGRGGGAAAAAGCARAPARWLLPLLLLLLLLLWWLLATAHSRARVVTLWHRLATRRPATLQLAGACSAGAFCCWAWLLLLSRCPAKATAAAAAGVGAARERLCRQGCVGRHVDARCEGVQAAPAQPGGCWCPTGSKPDRPATRQACINKRTAKRLLMVP
jgi:hypothetical protein